MPSARDGEDLTPRPPSLKGTGSPVNDRGPCSPLPSREGGSRGGGSPSLLLAPAAYRHPTDPPGATAGATGATHAGTGLTPAVIRDLAERLRAARAEGLARMPVAEIVAAIDQAVAGWAAPPAADVEALAAGTGYHPAMVALALADLARAFRAPALERLLRRELRDPAVLDRFVRRPDGGGLARAFGPELTTIVLAGNVFHVAAESIILALLAKSACMVKVSRRDPLFPLLFARSLAAVDERLAAALAVGWWPGGDVALEAAAFHEAGAVVAYGGAEAVAAVHAHTPAGTRLVAHGPKVSFAVVGRSYAAGTRGAAAAQAATHDVAMFDQQGCVSPHTIYVEGDAAAVLGFARRLAGAMAGVERETPRGRISAADASAIQQARGAAEFRPGAELLADPTGTAWTVIADPDPAFGLSCLNRVVYVKPLGRLEELPARLEPVAPYLQTVGVAGPARLRLAVADLLGPLGAARVCPLGHMQHPPADWRHDGRPRLLDLLRWTDVEQAGGRRQAARAEHPKDR